MKIFKRGKRYASIALTLVLAFIMMANVVPVHAEDGFLDGVATEVSIKSTNPEIYYQVRLHGAETFDANYNYGNGINLTSIKNESCVVNLEEQGLIEGESVIIHWGFSANNLRQQAPIDVTQAVFDLDDYVSYYGDPEDEYLDGVEPEFNLISANPAIYYQICVYEKYGDITNLTSVKNESCVVNLEEVELKSTDRFVVRWGFIATDLIYDMDINVQKTDSFDLSEFLSSIGLTTAEVTVASTSEAAKTTQFYFCIGDSYCAGSKFTDSESGGLVFTGALNMGINSVMLEDGDKPFIKLLDDNKTEIEFETLEDGSLFINLDNYVKQDDDAGQEVDDNQQSETEDLKYLAVGDFILINEGDVAKDFPEGISYDMDTNTLTLDNYDGEVVDTPFSDIDSSDEYFQYNPRHGIYAKGGALTINLVGENNFTDLVHYGYGIFGDEADITITGGGILNLNDCHIVSQDFSYTGSGTLNILNGILEGNRNMTLSGSGTINVNSWSAVYVGYIFTMESGNLNISLSYESEYDDENYYIYGINTRFIDDNGYDGEPSPQFNFNGGTVSITGEENNNNIYVGIDVQGGNMNIANTTIEMDLNGIWNMGIGVGNYSETSNTFYGGELSFTNSTVDVRMRAGYAAYFGELIGAEDIYYYTGTDKLTSVSFEDIFKHNWIDERYDYRSESELRLLMTSSKLEEGSVDGNTGEDDKNADNGNNDTDKPNQGDEQTPKPDATKISTTEKASSPKTGDNSNTMLYLVLLVSSGMLIIMRKKLFSLIR